MNGVSYEEEDIEKLNNDIENVIEEIRAQELLVFNVEDNILTIDNECPNEVGFCILDALETGSNNYYDMFGRDVKHLVEYY